jgi:hypothetical protein
MSNFYYDPQDFRLTPIGEVDWSDGNYCFDLTVVWQRDFDGKIVYAEDSGCSCPSPFEEQGPEDLTVCKPAELQAHIEQRGKDACYGDRAAEIADLMHRVMSAVSVPGHVAREAALTAPATPELREGEQG